MNEVKFNSIEELYNRLKPALNSKVKSFNKMGISYISDKNIWDYLSKNIWSNKNDLELCDLVNDILNVNENDILRYLNNSQY